MSLKTKAERQIEKRCVEGFFVDGGFLTFNGDTV